MECAHDLALEVKQRTFKKLRRIERALQSIRTADYGRCRQCGAEIPSRRLQVQPDAVFCVPCLSAMERQAPELGW